MSNAGLTEEDVKVLVVSEFLRDHGFGIDQLSFERTLTLRLGKQQHKRPNATGRLDILVRSIDGRPLLIVEVKAPALPLTDGDGAQAVSYARSIDEDRIPPYAVVTNGRATRIYDVLTRAELKGSSIPRDHPHAKNAFLLASADELALRAEALECFVGLSSDNLATFCAAQVADRMAALRSDDPRSGRKYIPSLYVERTAATTRLTSLLSAGRVVTLVVAPPQVGKTNFLCRYAERLVEQREPCIFYTAIGLGDGLLSELADDLGWMARERCTVPALVSKLSRIAERAGKPITLCLDGLNEASDQVVRTIDADCRRLAGVPLLRVVISLSSEAARRLLRDGAGNPSYIATGAGIPATGVELLQAEPHRACESWSVVSLRGSERPKARVPERRVRGMTRVPAGGFLPERGTWS